MHTGRSSARLVARSLLAEKETTQTRSQALVRRSTRASGAIAGASFTSMLNRTSGQAPSTSSSTGIGSVPPMRAPAISLRVSRAYPPRLAGDTVQRAVVKGDEHPVRRRLHVGLQVPVAEPDRVLERAPGILRRVGRAAPVGEGQRAEDDRGKPSAWL